MLLTAAEQPPTAPAGASGAAGEPLTGVRFMVPNTPGGGYDTTARAAAKVMEDAKITKGVEVFNLAGAGGTVGLQRTGQREGQRQAADADGARRRRRRVHQQVQGHARPRPPRSPS